MQVAKQAGVNLEAMIIAEGREAVRDLVAEGFGIGFVAESEIGSDIRLSRIRLEGVSPSMPETLAHLSARCDVPVIRSFMRTLTQTRSLSKSLARQHPCAVGLCAVLISFQVSAMKRQNVLFVVFDQLRADCLHGALGSGRGTSKL